MTRKEIENRRNEVMKLRDQGKTGEEIAEKLGISLSTVQRDIKFFKEQGEIIDKKPPCDQAILDEVKTLYMQGKSKKTIARKIEKSYSTVWRYIEYLKEQGEIIDKKSPCDQEILNNDEKIMIEKPNVIQTNLTVAQIKKICDDFHGQTESLKQLEEYISDCKIRWEENNIKPEELSTIERVVSLTDQFEDIIFYLGVCLKFGKRGEIMKFANAQIANEARTIEEREKIRNFKDKMKEVNRKYLEMKALHRQDRQEEIEEAGNIHEDH